MEGAQDRKARLRALREAAQLGGTGEAEGDQAAAPDAEPTQEPVLKFRNYAVKDEKIKYEKARAVVAASSRAALLVALARCEEAWGRCCERRWRLRSPPSFSQ